MRRITALAVAALSFAVAHAQKSPGPAAVENTIGMRMVLVPAGSFPMGSPPQAPMRQEEEHPHNVTLTRHYRISVTEVTQRQWMAVMQSNPSAVQGDDLPVTNVSWLDATEFCRRLSGKEKATYRLPSEAEWEYACRAGANDHPPRSALDGAAWFADNSEESTHPVGTKQPNGRGLHDMLGNVGEWMLDAYGPYPRVASVSDPTGPPSGTSRVVRGGSWRSFPPALRCAARTGTPESYQLPHVGFRVVQELK